MSLRQKIEDNLGIFFTSTLLSGILAGVALHYQPTRNDASPQNTSTSTAPEDASINLRNALAENEKLKTEVRELRSRLNASSGESTSSTAAAVALSELAQRIFGEQDFLEAHVEISRLQVTAEGKISTFITYRNKTDEQLSVAFYGKTFLIDDVGNYFDLDPSSGMGVCCGGPNRDELSGSGVPLVLPAKGEATTTLFFRASNEIEKMGTYYSISSEQVFGNLNASGGWRTKRAFNINIQDMKPR